LRIIGIQKLSKNAPQSLFILNTWDELSLTQVEKLIKSKALPAQIKTTKAGKKCIAALPNSHTTDNLNNITLICNKNDYLLFNGYQLLLKTGNGKRKRTWTATSGTPGSKPKDQDRKDFGPIPEGTYIARFDQTLDISSSQNLWDALKWLLKSPSWGLIATPLEPDEKTNTFGRHNFYLHGGFFPGSRGCIDLTSQNQEFHIAMRLYKRNMKLVVKYPKS
jgi:hypothetical protein